MSVNKVDQEIVTHAMHGDDLHEVYLYSCIPLAAERHLVTQILSTDASEMLELERAMALCNDYGL